MNIEGLDNKDQAILEVIKDHARMSYSDIGEKVGLSRVAVRNRMENMEKRGIIQGYKTIIDETKASEGISFILDIEAIPGEYQNVMQTLVSNRYLRQVYSTTGDCHIHCVGFAPNQRTLESHLNHLFKRTLGIKKLSLHMLLSTLKDISGGVEHEGYQKSEHMENRGKTE